MVNIDSKNYSLKAVFFDPKILFVQKSHQYVKSVHHECYASDWMVSYAVLPKNFFKIKTQGSWLSIMGPCFLFLPSFSLLEVSVESGELEWFAFGSNIPLSFVNPIPKICKSEDTSFENRLPINRAELFLLLSEIQTKGKTLISENSPNSVAEKLKSYIDCNFRNDLKIQMIAQTLNYSRVVMGRSFKNTYGISPLEYRHKLRIHEALVLVRKGASLTEALLEVGFKDPSQFIVQFKKILETSPHRYKIQQKQHILSLEYS